MQTYAEYQKQPNYADFSTGEFGDWLLAPCANGGYFGLQSESNWHTQLRRLEETGPEGADWRIIRIGHWVCGEIERVLVRPDTEADFQCEAMEAELDAYPLLDEDDFSQREQDAYQSHWDSGSAGGQLLRDFQREGKITAEQAEKLSVADLQRWFEGCIPNGDYYGEQCWPNLAAVEGTKEQIEKLLQLT